MVFNNEIWNEHKLQEFVWELIIEYGRIALKKCKKLLSGLLLPRGKLLRGLTRIEEKSSFVC